MFVTKPQDCQSKIVAGQERLPPRHSLSSKIPTNSGSEPMAQKPPPPRPHEEMPGESETTIKTKLKRGTLAATFLLAALAAWEMEEA
jgi:hypothetical protein